MLLRRPLLYVLGPVHKCNDSSWPGIVSTSTVYLFLCLSFVLASGDDSDTSSVCSISTCPGDLDIRRDSLNQPRMPIFQDSDTDQGAVSDQPKRSSGIRRRPPGVLGSYVLCRHYKRTRQPCLQGKLCPFAHSEAERKAWEEDRRKGK